MVIVHIITGLNNAGAETVLYRLVMADRMNSHHVVSLIDQGAFGELLTDAGIPVHTMGMPRGRVTFSALRKLVRLIRSIDADVFQTWLYHADLIGGSVAYLTRNKPVVWGLHHSNLNRDMNSRSTRWAAWACARLSPIIPASIIACSETTSLVHQKMGYKQDKLTVIPNGVDVHTFAPNPTARERIRAELGITPTEILIGMVARWDPLKDHANLLTSLKNLQESKPKGWRCVLVGVGMKQENAELAVLLKETRMDSRVILAGPRIDISDLMNALDLHVLSSSGESFGNVTIEAMACGVPSVVTDVGAGKHIVGDTGWTVAPSDSIALAGAIETAFAEIRNPLKWSQRQDACRLRIVEKFSLERMVEAYRAVWAKHKLPDNAEMET